MQEDKFSTNYGDNGSQLSASEAPQAFRAETHETDQLGREVSRITSRQLSRTQSRASAILAHALMGAEEFKEVPLMGGGKDYPPMLADREPYKVEFEGPDDPEMAQNWNMKRKARSVVPLSLAAFCSTWASSIYAPGIPEIMEVFHIGSVPATLGTSLYVLGYAAGPVVWGPISELYGRKMPLVLAYFLFMCFAFAAATAKDVQTLMICRFFTGASGSAPLVLVAAAFADIFTANQRGIAIVCFCCFVICGPMIAPVAGGFIANSYLGWRWLLYITGIFASAVLVVCLVFLDETFAPIILARKAREIRYQTNNWGVYAEHELIEFDIHDLLERTILRPFSMLMFEPILLLMSLFHGYIYGLLYMLLTAIPIIYQGYGFKGGIVELPYLAIFLGCMAAGAVAIIFFEPLYRRMLVKRNTKLFPEARLPLMMVGTVPFTVGIFWMCWCGAYPESVHWLAPTFGLAMFGFGFLAVFVPPFNYIVDTYLSLTASAMAANAFVRGAMGAAFPLFSAAMFHNLGIQWAGTLIGCLSALLLPVPFLFYKYGPTIRHHSKFAFNLQPPPQ